MKKQVFQEVRFSLYIAFVVNGIFIQWIAPYVYKCDYSEERCFACGLRTAVDLLIKGKVYDAYHSNKLIIVVVFAVLFMICDIMIVVVRNICNRT